MAVQNYWGNQSYAANQQQAQYAGMPNQQNYQSPPSAAPRAPNQQNAWSAPSQGSWQSAPSSGGGAAPQSSSGSGGAAWGSGQGGWAQPPAPQGYAAPQGYGGGQPAPANFASTGPSRTGGGADPYQQMAGWYEQYLGRTPSRAEMDSYLQHGTNTGNLQTYQQQIQHSQEAAAYQAAQLQAAQGQGLPPSWWQQQGGGGYPGQPGGGAPTPGRPYVPSGNANTDGYPMPQITQMPQAGAMPGWDSKKWSDPNHQTPKYVVGRLLQDIPPRTQNMAMAVARIAAAYPGARQIGPGDVSIPGVGTVDILQAAGAGGKAWQFGGGPGGGSSTQQGGGGFPQGQSMDPYSMYAQLLMQPQGPQYAAPVQSRQPAAPDNSAYMQQIQQLQTQLAEMRSGQNQQRGLNVTYF
jgi:hypothetical protein